MNPSAYLIGAWLFAILMGITIAVVAVVGCHAPGTPSTADEVKVGEYTAALHACIAEAKLEDSGLPGYQACADKVDAQYRKDASP